MAADAYAEYLSRFAAQIGTLAVGAHSMYRGKLIKKLSPVEFAAKHDEYRRLAAHYQQMITRGDTLSDALIKVIREREAELLLQEKSFT